MPRQSPAQQRASYAAAREAGFTPAQARRLRSLSDTAVARALATNELPPQRTARAPRKPPIDYRHDYRNAGYHVDYYTYPKAKYSAKRIEKIIQTNHQGPDQLQVVLSWTVKRQPVYAGTEIRYPDEIMDEVRRLLERYQGIPQRFTLTVIEVREDQRRLAA